MNERIKTLADQSGADNVELPHGCRYALVGEESIQKFAELIVRECARVAFNDWCNSTNEASSEKAILEHFGFEW